MKPGHLTTEFWVIVLTNLGLVVAALAEALPPKWAALGVAVANAAYAVARGLAKLGTTPTPVVPVEPVVTDENGTGLDGGGR